MKIKLFLIVFVLLLPLLKLIGQERTDANVFGHVLNARDGEHVPFINLIIEGTHIGTITDVSGHFKITNIPEGSHRLIVAGMGYKTATADFEITRNQTLEINITVEYVGINVEELVITSSPTQSGFRYQPDQVFIGEELLKRSEASFGEMINGEPGVAMRSFGPITSRPVIRGLDGDRILVLENGERMGDISATAADHSIALDPLAITRLEVIRGPASLLYGSNALGGVVNLMTTDIPDRWDLGSSGVLSLKGASMNRMGAGFARYTYGGEDFSFSGRFAYRQAGNVNTPDGVLPGTEMDNYDGAIGFGIDNEFLNGGLSLSLTGQNFGIPEFVENPNEGIELQFQRQAIQGRFIVENKGFFDRVQARFNATRMEQQEVEWARVDNTIEESVGLEFGKTAISSTITLQHKPVNIFDRGAVGFNLHGHELMISGTDIFIPDERRLSLGVFTFQEIPLSRTLRLQFGLRFDYMYAGALPNERFPDIKTNRNTINYSGSFGFNYRPLEGLEMGGQFARSHRNLRVEELFADGVHLGAGTFELGDVNLNDEIGQGADLFFIWENGILQFELATFVNYFRNYIIFQPTGTIEPVSGFPIYRYEGDVARFVGGEFSVGFHPLKNLSMDFGIDYVDGRRLSNSRQFIPFIPPFRFKTNIEYDFEFGWLEAEVHHAAKQDRVAPEEDVTNGYTLLGFTAGYRLQAAGKHVIILRVDNLLNTRYRDHLSRIEGRNFPMPGRNISLAYRWFL